MDEHGQPDVLTYIRVFAVLVVVTVVEVGVFYVPVFQSVLVPILLVLSTLKFALVALFYMHLKTDHALLRFLFGAPLLLAVAVVVSLLLLFFGALTLRGAA
jgi:caa(3)-type oxidase subunit IV